MNYLTNVDALLMIEMEIKTMMEGKIEIETKEEPTKKIKQPAMVEVSQNKSSRMRKRYKRKGLMRIKR